MRFGKVTHMAFSLDWGVAEGGASSSWTNLVCIRKYCLWNEQIISYFPAKRQTSLNTKLSVPRETVRSVHWHQGRAKYFCVKCPTGQLGDVGIPSPDTRDQGLPGVAGTNERFLNLLVFSILKINFNERIEDSAGSVLTERFFNWI